MAQCDTHYLENCRLCKSAPTVKNAAGEPFGELPTSGWKAVLDAVLGTPELSSHTDKPEIIDPAARNAMLLATALDDVATMKGVVANLNQMLRTSKEKLAEAESTSHRLLAELTKAINEKDGRTTGMGEDFGGRSRKGDAILSDVAAHDTAKNA